MPSRHLTAQPGSTGNAYFLLCKMIESWTETGVLVICFICVRSSSAPVPHSQHQGQYQRYQGKGCPLVLVP